MSHSTYVAPPSKEDLERQLNQVMQKGIQANQERGRMAAKKNMLSRNNIYKSDRKDDSVYGAGPLEEVKRDIFVREYQEGEKLDLSWLLNEAVHYASGKQKELEGLLEELQKWPPTSAEMQRSLNLLTEEINLLLREKRLDAEDVLDHIRSRIEIYLENVRMEGPYHLEELYTEYYSLCDFLGLDADEEEIARYSIEELEYKTEIMRQQAEVFQHRIFTAEVFQEVMETLGMELQEFSTLDGNLDGEVYGSEENPEVKIFVSHQSESFVFEPLVDVEEINKEYRDPDDVLAAIKEPCKLHQRIIQEAARRGLVLYLANAETPGLHDVATTLDLTNRRVVQTTEEKEKQTAKQERRKRFETERVRAIE